MGLRMHMACSDWFSFFLRYFTLLMNRCLRLMPQRNQFIFFFRLLTWSCKLLTRLARLLTSHRCN